jgi:hypothetical protein
MRHIALCTPCIAAVNGGHLLHMRVDHVELELEESTKQAQDEDFIIIVLIKATPGASYQSPCLLCLKLYL